MRQILFIFFTTIFFVSLNAQSIDRSKAPEAGAAPKIKIGSYESFDLDNGLKVFVVENRKIPRVSMRLTVDADPIFEDNVAGAMDMMGSLLRRGTTNRTKQEIDEAVDFMGASLRTGPGGISAGSLTKHLPDLLEIVSDVLMNPVFAEDELEKVRKKTLSNLASQKDDSRAIARNVARVLRYGKKHPYGEIATEETINNILASECRQLYKSFFRPNISYLVIVGDISAEEAKPLVDKYFGSWKKAQVPDMAFDMPVSPETNKVTFVNKEAAEQSYVLVTYPIDLKPNDEDVIAASVMSEIFGGGNFNSRLMQNLREDKAFTYGAYGRLAKDEWVGYFSAGASVRNEVTDSALVEIMREMKRIVNEPVTEEELQLTKNIMTGSFARALEKPQTVARFALNTERYDLPKDYYRNYLKKIEAVTIEDVQRVAQKYIRPDKAHILVVGNQEEVADKLKIYSENMFLDYVDYLGNPIQKPIPLPVGVTSKSIIQKYINATGGKKWKKVKSLVANMSVDAGNGIIMKVENYQQKNNKACTKVMYNENMVQHKVVNGTKGFEKAGGEKRNLSAKELKDELVDSAILPELLYETLGYETNLIALEKINGQDAYKVEIIAPTGTTYTDYFAEESGLKLRTIKKEMTADGQTLLATTDYADYKQVGNIKVPHTLKVQTGPQTMEIKVEEAEVNKKVDKALFVVE